MPIFAVRSLLPGDADGPVSGDGPFTSGSVIVMQTPSGSRGAHLLLDG